MVKRRVDNRVRILIENGIVSGHRSLYIIVGEKSREQVIFLHHILSKASLKQADVLWCYKSKLHYSSNRKKRMKELKAKQKFGNASVNEDDPFEMFVSMTNIVYRYYRDTHKILGNTFKMCVLQDFETLTPNILCRTIETVEGGGVIVILLDSMTSLKQLYTLNMDVHSRYRTEAHQVIVPRFNERFILSLASCKSCLVLNDELQIVPVSSSFKDIEPLPFSYSDAVLSEKNEKLKAMQDSVKDIKPLGTLLGLCKTLDQGIVVKQFISAITENTLSSTITLTAARGRGKSAAMGLSLAGAIYVGYANIFVTSPSPENLKIFFEFLLKGLDALGYEKHIDYETLLSSDPEHNKAVLNVTVKKMKKEYKQFVQYITPYESDVLDNAELVVIDEAAAIPLPQVQALLGPYLVFLASTISGYEGTGRSLSLKLIKDLREQAKESESDSVKTGKSGWKKKKVDTSSTKRKLIELSLDESIRYKAGDPIEKWLYDLLCLESSLNSSKDSLSPEDCTLYYVNRDVLFCYHKMTEKFLKNVMTLLVASHYKNTPDDLQMLSDAPAHHLFVLISPTENEKCPQPVCVIQVVLEGKISKISLESLGGSSQRKPAGDMIPWTIKNCYDDDEFPQLSGARIVRIATHPDLQGKGFGTRAMKLLEEYYSRAASKASTEDVVPPESKSAFKCVEDEEIGNLKSEKSGELSEPLLISVDEREPEPLHYLGVSFGSSFSLVKFWKKLKFTPVYISEVRNVQTGEYSSLFIKKLNEDKISRQVSWLKDFWFEFKDAMTVLLRGPFRHMETKLALSFLLSKTYKRKQTDPSVKQLKTLISSSELMYLSDYLNHSKEFHQIANLFSILAILYFTDKISFNSFKNLRQAIIVGVGVQKKNPSVVAKELQIDLPILMGELYSITSEIYQYLNTKYSNGGES